MFGLGELVTTLVGGGGTGFFGALVSNVTDIFKQREDNRHEEAMADKELDIAKVESERKISIAEREAEAQEQVASDQADAKVREKSYEMDKRTYLSKKAMEGSRFATIAMAVVDFARGITRPVLTGGIAIFAAYVYWRTQQITGGIITDEAYAYELLKMTTLSVFFYLGLALSWWFGSRSKFMGGKGFKKSSLKED